MDIVHYVKSEAYTKIRVLEVLRHACEIPQKSVADAINILADARLIFILHKSRLRNENICSLFKIEL